MMMGLEEEVVVYTSSKYIQPSFIHPSIHPSIFNKFTSLTPFFLCHGYVYLPSWAFTPSSKFMHQADRFQASIHPSLIGYNTSNNLRSATSLRLSPFINFVTSNYPSIPPLAHRFTRAKRKQLTSWKTCRLTFTHHPSARPLIRELINQKNKIIETVVHGGGNLRSSVRTRNLCIYCCSTESPQRRISDTTTKLRGKVCQEAPILAACWKKWKSGRKVNDMPKNTPLKFKWRYFMLLEHQAELMNYPETKYSQEVEEGRVGVSEVWKKQRFIIECTPFQKTLITGHTGNLLSDDEERGECVEEGKVENLQQVYNLGCKQISCDLSNVDWLYVSSSKVIDL
ncbi:hypothetical protein EGR_04907 [Echinococcus granulosus]|uniref:Uncharacterized protein n=1 Tax=Echinococcus granulosus TaxID=6210 RepID=W6UPJ8_ECHGR|nr:hypothetical protein EGR_04907 [Echinococcus granulosus]EUB60197.1 hypothetical protein EGR_04907 [Echinococcus granulosus]